MTTADWRDMLPSERTGKGMLWYMLGVRWRAFVRRARITWYLWRKHRRTSVKAIPAWVDGGPYSSPSPTHVISNNVISGTLGGMTYAQGPSLTSLPIRKIASFDQTVNPDGDALSGSPACPRCGYDILIRHDLHGDVWECLCYECKYEWKLPVRYREIQ